MVKSICASCENFSISNPIKSLTTKKPKWLEKHDYVEEFIKSQTVFKTKYKKGFDQIIPIDLGKNYKHRFLLYWAAMPSSDLKVKDAKTAYDIFQNHGIVKLNAEGRGSLRLKCPQIYYTVKKGEQKEKSFYRHFHYVISNESNEEWLSQLYSNLLVCKRDVMDVKRALQQERAVLLNALPASYYAKEHIPNSYNIVASEVEKMSKVQWNAWLMDVLEANYKRLYIMVKNKDILLEEVPIICYCAHETCDASRLLEEELLKKSMYRVDSFPGGMRAWQRQ